MYWQKRFDRENPDAELEAKIKAIRQSDKDFGYRRIYGKLRQEGFLVNLFRAQKLNFISPLLIDIKPRPLHLGHKSLFCHTTTR